MRVWQVLSSISRAVIIPFWKGSYGGTAYKEKRTVECVIEQYTGSSALRLQRTYRVWSPGKCKLACSEWMQCVSTVLWLNKNIWVNPGVLNVRSHHTAHCAEKIVAVCLRVDSVSHAGCCAHGSCSVWRITHIMQLVRWYHHCGASPSEKYIANSMICHGTPTIQNSRVCYYLLFHERGKQNFM